MPDRYIALIAHDAKKPTMLEVVTASMGVLKNERLVATGTTGGLVAEKTGLTIKRMASGPQGGDLQIGAMIAAEEVKLVIFLRDPLSPHPHEPDIQALMKVCDVHNVPLATNLVTALLCLEALADDAPKFESRIGNPT